MATNVLPNRSVTIRVQPRTERVFYSAMAVLLCLAVYVGFAPTYFGVGFVRASLPSPILHVHGLIFTLWMLLFVAQTMLISARRVALHRTVGTIGFCLPPIMVVLGVFTAIDALRRNVSIGPLDPAVSFAIPMVGVIGFVPVISAAWMKRREPAAHKRLVLLATIGLTAAAFGRFPWDRIGLPPAAGALTGSGSLILLMVIYELVTTRRVHRATAWAAPLVFLSIAAAVPIGMTGAWHHLADMLR